MAVSQTTSGAFGGAGQGAAAGAAFGPIGAGVGAVLGGAFGALTGSAAKDAEKAQRDLMRMRYNEQYRGLRGERDMLLGAQTARYAASGVLVGAGSARQILEETRSEYARRMGYVAAAYSRERQGAQAQTQAAQWGDLASGILGAAQVGATAYANDWFKRPSKSGGSAGGGQTSGSASFSVGPGGGYW